MLLVKQGQQLVAHGESKVEPHALDESSSGTSLQSKEVSNQVGFVSVGLCPLNMTKRKDQPFFTIP